MAREEEQTDCVARREGNKKQARKSQPLVGRAARLIRPSNAACVFLLLLLSSRARACDCCSTAAQQDKLRRTRAEVTCKHNAPLRYTYHCHCHWTRLCRVSDGARRAEGANSAESNTAARLGQRVMGDSRRQRHPAPTPFLPAHRLA
jgi:hypothetical protein